MIKNILVLGSIAGQTKQRVRAFQELGYQVDTVSDTALNHAPGINYQPTLLDRARNKLGFPADKFQINKQLLNKISKEHFDLLWVEKCLCLKPSTLKALKKLQPNLVLIWYSGDDMFARHNQSAYFRKSLPRYDLVVTTKSYNCNTNELPTLGAKRVCFVDKGFDKIMHAPVVVSEDDKEKLVAKVGFIGTYEAARARSVLYLAKHGIPVRIWGNGWKEFARTHPHPKLHVENKPIYDDNYQKAICATEINLCFLRKLNRDLQTDRTMEIPACGAFMLAERTEEHQRLFVEDKEAVFFDSNNDAELLAKVQYYLARGNERLVIARAGYKRCYRDDYTHEHRLRDVLKKLEAYD